MLTLFKSLSARIAFWGVGILVALLQTALAATLPTNPGADRAEMPVRAVVLFSSGVGYFEHSGAVQANGSTELRFKTDQINDILKSLVLEDLDGGKIENIVYPSQDPVEKTLHGFQVDIASNPAFPDLLNQLRGSPVLVKVNAEQIEGTILGLEKRQKILTGHNDTMVDDYLFNILSGPAIRSVWLNDVQSVEMRDPELERDLQKALAALAEARNQDKKAVVINFQGEGSRKVRLRYVIETPVWKTSYRLILPQKDKGKSKLQGWALVENQTDTDWDNVQLSLVSCRPISFVEDLYKPIYVSRPVVTPEFYKSLLPQSYETGMTAMAPAAAPREEMPLSPSKGGAAAGRGESIFKKHMMGYGGETEFDATSSVVSAASAEKLGDLFQYSIGSVSLPRQRSAMFPILTEDVAAERVSIYNQDVMPRNPLRGVLLRNSTDKHIMQGPITVFEGSTYAGDTQIGNTPPGHEKLISYALDLDILVDAKTDSQVSPSRRQQSQTVFSK